MATYTAYGSSASLFDAWTGSSLASARLYDTSTEFGMLNADGSKTYLIGAGLIWDASVGKFTGGTIEEIDHYSAAGEFVDELSNLNLEAANVQAAFEQSGSPDALPAYFLAGDDTLDASHRADDRAFPESLVGYGGNDLIIGGAGNDKIWGYDGLDTIKGGAGDDYINGGGDDDNLQGGSGDDRLVGDAGADRLSGGAGNDAIYAGAGNDSFIGGAGTDTAVYYRSFYDLIITVTHRGYHVIEPNGHDTLVGIDQIAADEGVFVYDAVTREWERVADTPGELLIEPANKHEGTQADDAFNLSAYGVTMGFGYGGDDSLTGTGGWDLLKGGDGNDVLFGKTGQDRLHGDSGNDRLRGMGGTDLLYGGDGNDSLIGGDGNDTLTGGAGSDTFMFSSENRTANAHQSNDVINDFEVGIDKLELHPLNGSATDLTPSLSLTSSGWELALADGGTILLKGLMTPDLTLADLLA